MFCLQMCRHNRLDSCAYKTWQLTLGSAETQPAARRRTLAILGALLMSTCVVWAGPLSAAEPEVVAAAQQPAEIITNRKSTNEAQIDELRRQLDKARMEVKRLNAAADYSKVELAAVKNKLNATVAQMEALVRVRGEALTEIMKLRAGLAAVRRESRPPKSQLAELEKSKRARDAAVKALAKARADKLEQDSVLRETKKAAEESIARARGLRDGLQAAEHKIAALETKLTKARSVSAKADDMARELMRADKRIKNLTAAAERAAQRTTTLKNKLGAATARLDKVVTEKNAARSKVSRLEASLAAVRRDAERQRSELAALAKVANAHEANVRQLANVKAKKAEQDEALRDAKNAAEASAARASELRTDLQAAGEKTRKLQAKLNEVNASAAKAEELRIALRDAEQRIKSLSSASKAPGAELAGLKRKLQLATAKMDSVVAEKNAALSDVAELKSSLAEARQVVEQRGAALAALAEAKKAHQAAVQDIARLTKARTEQDKQLTETKKAVRIAKTEAENLRGDLRIAGKKIVTLEARLNKQSASLANAATARSKLQLAERQIENLTATAKKSAAASAALKDQLHKATAKVDALAKEKAAALREAKKTNETSLAQAAELRGDLASANAKITALEAKLGKASASMVKADELRKGLQQRIESLRGAADKSASEAGVLKDKLKAVSAQLDALTAEKDSTQSEILKLSASLRAVRGEADRHKTKLAELATSKRERVSALDTLAKVRAAKQIQEEATRRSSAMAETSKAEAARLRKDLAATAEKITTLTANLDKARGSVARADELRAGLQRRIDSLTAEAKKSTTESTILKGKLQLAVSKMQALATENDNALSQISKFKASLDAAHRETARRKAELAELAKSKQVLNSTAEALAKAQAAKKIQDEALRKANKAAATSAAKAKVLSADLEASGQKIQALQAKLERAGSSAVKADGLRTRLQRAEQKIASLTKTTKQTIESLTGVAKNSKAELAVTKRELEVALSKTDALVAERDAARSEIAKLRASLVAIRKEARQREAKLAELTEPIELARKTASNEDSEARATAGGKDEKLASAVKAAERSAREVKMLHVQLAAKQRRLDEMKGEISKALSDVRSVREQISRRIEKMIDLAVAAPTAEFAELKKKYDAASKEIVRLKAELGKKSAAKAAQ